MSWNYRIGTQIFSYKKAFPDNPKLGKMFDQRLFSIIEVYYDKNGKPNGYSDTQILSNWEDLDDLIGTVDLVKLALKKPIINIDSFPDEYKI